MPQEEDKKEFARLLVSMGDPGAAAFELFPDADMRGYALEIAQKWPKDPYVIHARKQYERSVDPADVLPTAVEAGRELYERAMKETDNEVFIKLMNLYGKWQGFEKKPDEAGGNTNNTINNNILVLESHGDVDEWGVGIAAQQKRLMGN